MAAHPRARHARPRLDAVRRRQRAREGGRGRAAASPPTGRRPRSTTCGAPTPPRSTSTPRPGRAWSIRRGSGRRASHRRCPHRQVRPRLHPHHVLAERRPRRHKTNVIPDEVVLEVDIRILPGETGDDVRRHAGRCPRPDSPPTSTIEPCTTAQHAEPDRHAAVGRHRRAVGARWPEATLLPRITAGGTDASFFRDAGSRRLRLRPLVARRHLRGLLGRFHGNDERIDVESLRLTTQCWLDLCPSFLG